MLHCVAMVRMGLPSVSIVAHAAPSPRPSSRATPHPGAPLPQQPATDSAAEILPASSRGMLRNSPAEHGSKRLSCPACAASHRALMRQPSTSCIQAALSRPLPGGSRSGCFVPPAPPRVWPCMCVAPRSWVQREPLPPRRPAIRCACAAAASSARALSPWSTASARVEPSPSGSRASSALPAALPALGLRSAGSWHCFSSCDCNCLEQ